MKIRKILYQHFCIQTLPLAWGHSQLFSTTSAPFWNLRSNICLGQRSGSFPGFQSDWTLSFLPCPQSNWYVEHFCVCNCIYTWGVYRSRNGLRMYGFRFKGYWMNQAFRHNFLCSCSSPLNSRLTNPPLCSPDAPCLSFYSQGWTLIYLTYE